MLDPVTAKKVRDLLYQAAKLIDASLNASRASVEECSHESYQELTTLGALKRSYLCITCGNTWQEEFNEEGLKFDRRGSSLPS